MKIADYTIQMTPGRDDVLLTVSASNGMTFSGGITAREAVSLIRQNDDDTYIVDTIRLILAEIYEDSDEALDIIETITI